MKKIFFALIICSLVLMGASCGKQAPAPADQQPAQPQVEGKELMTIQEAKKVADPVAAKWAKDAVVEKTFQSVIDEDGTSNAWYFYYCSPSQNKIKYLTVKKEQVVSQTDQGECSYDQQGGEVLKMDSPAVYNLAKDEIDKFKKDHPDAYVIISLLRYNGLDYHYMWEVQAFPDDENIRPSVVILTDDDGKVIDVTEYSE